MDELEFFSQNKITNPLWDNFVEKEYYEYKKKPKPDQIKLEYNNDPKYIIGLNNEDKILKYFENKLNFKVYIDYSEQINTYVNLFKKKYETYSDTQEFNLIKTGTPEMMNTKNKLVDPGIKNINKTEYLNLINSHVREHLGGYENIGYLKKILMNLFEIINSNKNVIFTQNNYKNIKGNKYKFDRFT